MGSQREAQGRPRSLAAGGARQTSFKCPPRLESSGSAPMRPAWPCRAFSSPSRRPGSPGTRWLRLSASARPSRRGCADGACGPQRAFCHTYAAARTNTPYDFRLTNSIVAAAARLEHCRDRAKRCCYPCHTGRAAAPATPAAAAAPATPAAAAAPATPAAPLTRPRRRRSAYRFDCWRRTAMVRNVSRPTVIAAATAT